MRIHLLAAGTRRPQWESDGFDTYARRMPREIPLLLTEIAVEKRSPGAAVTSLVDREGTRMLKSVPAGTLLLALDERGKSVSTGDVAEALRRWMHEGRDPCFVIGGPDGLAPAVKQAAEQIWSLSPLTLPHGLARVVLAEQLYRAISLLRGHPYHRA